MRRCTRVGVNVTKRCNWKCKTCFYRHAADFNADYHRPLTDVMAEIEQAKGRGCDHVVLIGWGEPGLWPHIIDMIKAVKTLSMTSSIITNGSLAVSHYATMREAGLDHLHVSVHGVDEVLDQIVEQPGAGRKQEGLMAWLKAENWPWRMNMTVQLGNYKHLLRIASRCLYFGCRHIISLGFLPHYEWTDPVKMRTVAVHPAELRPYIESVGRLVDAHNEYAIHGYKAMFTIRYHPMCHINEQYRKHIVNARYVLFDPWEWEYGHVGKSDQDYWAAAVNEIGGAVAINEPPCTKCGLYVHCGGWNRTSAAGFDGAGLTAIDMPEDTKKPGWLHDQNPANWEKGFFNG